MTDALLRTLAIIEMIARILTGEIGVVPQAAPAVAQVAMNRLEMGWGWRGWHAIAETPAPWAIEAAWRAWWRGGDAEGDLFALSESDIVKLGFDKANWTDVGTKRWPVYVGKEWR